MAKMSKEEFVQQYILNNVIENNDLDKLGFAMTMAGKIWDCIREEYKADPSKSGGELEDDKQEWFDGIWSAWNKGIPNGSKGGKADALEAFKKSSINNRDLAVTAFNAATQHATKTRKELEAKGSTPPYFNKWFNSGAWDTRVEEVTIEGEVVAKEDPAITELRESVSEIDDTIRHLNKLEKMSGANQIKLITQAKERKTKLESELKSLEK